MEEGTILKWMVRAGDRVGVGDPLFELETDKATIEVEAEAAGRVARIVVGEGETAPVKTPIAYLAETDAELESFLASGGSPAPSQAEAPVEAPLPRTVEVPVPASGLGRAKASPAARKAAEILGVDLSMVVPGSGPSGRILVEDVERAAASPIRKPPVEGRMPLPKMRRAIAANLQRSKQTVPHFYMKLTADAGPMMSALAEAKKSYPCGVNDLVVSLVARVVAEMPEFRSRIEGDDLVVAPEVGVGIAVALDGGLVVPVLTRAGRLSLRDAAIRCRELVQSAQQGRLEGVGEAAVTISNLGMYGVEEFSAIINPPESAILAVGAVREDVLVRDGALRVGRVVTMVLSADHRVVDGVVAARFMARLKSMIEAPFEVEGLL